MKIFLSLILYFVLAFLNTAYALQGWQTNQRDKDLIYTPSEIEDNKIFRVTVYAPAKLNRADLKTILLTSAEMLQKPLGKPLKPWTVESSDENNNKVTKPNAFKDSQGNTLYVNYMAITTPGGDSYILQTISSLDKIKKYAPQIPNIFKDVLQANTPLSLAKTNNKSISPENRQKPLGKTKSDKARNIIKLIRTPPGQGAKISDIEIVWGNIYFNSLVGTVIPETSILFKDGSVYQNCKIPPTELDVQQSKRLQIAGDVYKRGKWTTWRKSGTGYEIKSLRTGKWKKLEGEPARAGSNNDVAFNTKYLNAGGSQIKGSWKNTITFKPNGRFEMSSFSMQDNSALGGGGSTSDAMPYISRTTVSDKRGHQGAVTFSGASEGADTITRIGGGSSSKKGDGSANTGSYKLDGYRIILEHDNGFVHSELFYFTNQDKNVFFVYKDKFYAVPMEDRNK